MIAAIEPPSPFTTLDTLDIRVYRFVDGSVVVAEHQNSLDPAFLAFSRPQEIVRTPMEEKVRINFFDWLPMAENKPCPTAPLSSLLSSGVASRTLKYLYLKHLASMDASGSVSEEQIEAHLFKVLGFDPKGNLSGFKPAVATSKSLDVEDRLKWNP